MGRFFLIFKCKEKVYLGNLYLTNFKNYAEDTMQFSPNINCFIGDNGVGKTNILDAIYYLSFCKSYFNQPDTLITKHGFDFFSIRGTYINLAGGKDEVLCQFDAQKRQKRFKKNGKKYNRLADHIGQFPLVMVSPYDRDLINNSSEVRRKYLDSVIAQFDSQYLYYLIRYNKAVSQRNAVLKSFAKQRYFDATLLEVWDKEIIATAGHIYDARKAFIIDFVPIFKKYFEWISGGKEAVDILYQSRLHKEQMSYLLQQNLSKDRILTYTSVGIHKDDLNFFMKNFPVKRYASQGQQKSFVIAIKLAQFEYMKQAKSVKPILLLDDIFDKLDHMRVSKIIDLVNTDAFGQVFITDTQPERIMQLFAQSKVDHKIFEIAKDTINLM